MRAHASFRPCTALISPMHVKFSENVTLDLSDAPVYRAVVGPVLYSSPSKTEKNSATRVVFIGFIFNR